MGSSLDASKDIGIEVTDLALTCGSEPVVDGYVLQWLAQIVLVAYLTQAPVARTSSDVCCVGENTMVSLKIKWMTTACTFIIFVIQHERLISVDIVPHGNTFFSEESKRVSQRGKNDIQIIPSGKREYFGTELCHVMCHSRCASCFFSVHSFQSCIVVFS